jgi:hypothetical protein
MEKNKERVNTTIPMVPVTKGNLLMVNTTVMESTHIPMVEIIPASISLVRLTERVYLLSQVLENTSVAL